MYRTALLAVLALPIGALAAFANGGTAPASVTLRIASATGEPVALTGTVLGQFEPGRSPVTRLSGTTPYEVAVSPGDFTGAFWETSGGPGLVVEVVEGADTTRFQSEPASEHVLVDRRGESFHLVGSALGR